MFKDPAFWIFAAGGILGSIAGAFLLGSEAWILGAIPGFGLAWPINCWLFD